MELKLGKYLYSLKTFCLLVALKIVGDDCRVVYGFKTSLGHGIKGYVFFNVN